jgi:hypothetical protein
MLAAASIPALRLLAGADALWKRSAAAAAPSLRPLAADQGSARLCARCGMTGHSMFDCPDASGSGRRQAAARLAAADRRSRAGSEYGGRADA